MSQPLTQPPCLIKATLARTTQMKICRDDGLYMFGAMLYVKCMHHELQKNLAGTPISIELEALDQLRNLILIKKGHPALIKIRSPFQAMAAYHMGRH